MSNILKLMPELEGEEVDYIQGLVETMSDEQAQTFIQGYRGRRKKPDHILLFALIGLISVAGVHRFVLGQIGMGILYLLTGGFCLVGTIIDLVNHKKLAFEHNQKIAFELASTVKHG